MNKKVAGVIIAIVAISGITGIVVANKSDTGKSGAQTDSAISGHDMGQMENMGTDQQAHQDEGQAGSSKDLTGQSEVSMDISNFAFTQPDIKISKGTKVTWTNRDDIKHNVFSKDEGGPHADLLAKGESYSFTFDKAGTYNYICEPHPYMKGSVDVIE